MRKFLLKFLILLSGTLSAFSQNFIEGTVTNSQGEALQSVVVKILMRGKIASYARSNNRGEFKIKIPDEMPDTLILVADCMGFKQLKQSVLKGTQEVNLVMSEASTTLKEITVAAPNIRQRGDTMRYRLNAFTGKSDQSLEDGLKRLPGVEVGETGKVSYQGKEISDFYVENQQLVGANYGLVTKNMPAEYVTDVEFVENYQAAAIDKGKMSDNVALNVKLSNKAKFRPVGTAEALAGEQRNRFLYRLGATGMIFTPKFQTMLSLKLGNYGKSSGIFFDASSSRLTNYASSALGSLSGATPPLKRDVYAIGNDISGTLNFLRAFSPSKTLRVNLIYDFEQSRNFYSQSSIYTIDGKKIEFSESGDPHSMSHLPFLNVKYTLNDPDKYVSNDFSSKLEIRTNEFNLMSDGRPYSQKQQIRALTIADNFGFRKKIDGKTYSISTNLSFLISPTATISIVSPQYLRAFQSASSHTFAWTASTGFEWKRGLSLWSLPLSADISLSRLYSDLTDERSVSNSIASTETNIRVSPSYEYSQRGRKIEIYLGMPATIQLFHANNRFSDAKANIDRIIISPIFRLNYNPDSRFKISFNSVLNHSTGDILDLLTNEIMTDFRNVKTASGVIGKTKNFNTGLKIAFKNAVNMLFADVGVNYSHSVRNTINSLYIKDDELNQGAFYFDNTSDAFSSSAMVSKNFYKAGINLSLRGNFYWSKNHTFQQDRLIKSISTSYSIEPKINIKPHSFFELNYNALIGKTFTRFQNSHTGIFSMNNDLHLSFYPAEGWDIFGETSILRKELSDGSYKDFALFNMGATWKFKKYRLTLRADNLLDVRHYNYSVFNGINIYNYDFALTGRTIYLKFTLTL